MTIGKKLKGAVMGLLMILGVVMVPAGVGADGICPEGSLRYGDPTVKNIGQCNVEANEGSGTSDEKDVMYYVNQIINVVLGLLGVVAVVVIILSGVQIATANGDPGKVKKGTQAIMYAVVGLIVALLAFAIVNFVLNNVFK